MEVLQVPIAHLQLKAYRICFSVTGYVMTVMQQQQILFQGSGKRIMESCCIHKKHHHGCLSGMMVILANSKVSICSLNIVQAQHFSDSVKSHKNGAGLVIKLSTTVSRSMAEDEIQHCQAQKDKIKYCSGLCVLACQIWQMKKHEQKKASAETQRNSCCQHAYMFL